MAGTDLDDWPADDMRQSPEIVARLAALDDPEILYGLASRMIRDRPRFTWYLEPVCDRLPAAELRRLAGEAVQAREDGANDAADNVIAYISLHQPESLTAHLQSLWDVRPNARSYYASWPWRAAGDAEVARLLEVARDPAGPDAVRGRVPAADPPPGCPGLVAGGPA